jgi:hypothetical protein
MTREESWQAQGATLAILRHVTTAGYVVSVFRFPSSLFGSRPAAVEIEAIDVGTDPPQQHVARVVVGEARDIEYQCAELLAAMVGETPEVPP